MKNFITLFGFLLIASAIVFSRYFFTAMGDDKTGSGEIVNIPPPRITNGYLNAVWDWNFPKKSDESSKQIVTALSERGINAVYLNIGSYVDIHEQSESDKKTNDLLTFKTNLRSYIIAAQDAGIRVHAVAGGKNWGDSSHRYLNKIVIDFVFNFNQQNPEASLAGLQFDIEPYSQDGFFANQGSILSQYLDTVDEITKEVSRLQIDQANVDAMDLGFAVPYWFDGENGNMEKVMWKGEEKFVLYHLLNRLNTVQDGYIAIMSYRNFANDRDGVIEHSKTEVSFLTEFLPKVSIVIAQETTNIQPKKTTYFGKKFSYMNDQLEKIVSSFEDSENFKGFAFNSAEAFLEIK